MTDTQLDTPQPAGSDPVEAALLLLDAAPPSAPTSAEQAEMQEPEPTETSPTLAALAESRRPKDITVCEACPNSVWFASTVEVKCYCRVMFLVTWSSKEPNQLTHCDGQFLGQDE